MKMFSKSIGVFVVALAVAAILAFTARMTVSAPIRLDQRLATFGDRVITVSAGDRLRGNGHNP